MFCFAGFYAAALFFLYLSKHSPSSPLVATGQVVSLNNHGQIFFVRWWEAWLAQGELAFIGIMLLGTLFLRHRYGAAAYADDGGRESPWLKWLFFALMGGTMIYMFLPK